MSDTTTLTIKIPLKLKEKIKSASQETQVSLSTEVCERLEKSFEISDSSLVRETDQIDNQNTEEQTEEPLSHKELRKIRQLLHESNDKSKKSSKKK